MSNTIKYSTQTENNTLKKGDFVIGVNDVDYGPTSETGYHNTITPPSGGYVIYKNRGDNQRSVYVAQDDTELVTLKDDFGATGSTANDILVWAAQQNDVLILNNPLDNIVTDGLQLYFDAGLTSSYPKGNTKWYDLSGNNYDGILTNGPEFDNNNQGNIVFDGSNDFIDIGSKPNLRLHTGGTICIFFKWNSYNGTSYSNTLIGRGGSSWVNHHYILFKHSQTNRLHLSISNGVTAMASGGVRSTFDIELDRIYYVVVTIDSTVKKMYIDGQFNKQVNSTIMPISTSSTVSLGRTGSSVYYLDGNIYNVKIYDRVLSSEEILQNYNAQKSRFGL